ncbi:MULTISPECIES: hypothetical protein [unclassified Bradyrhizobium]|uniref:hypothetical protein n=1 Tax=unclassified Bradyrhizobium TaxID=2631580 RepID=UPI001CD70F5A|nr:MULTISPECIES: hypothetical protein [unclassified Bradyrhizobium]MCA1378934.1 hypothetical protein [Bradyrhizobium sp. IC4060]MCA1489011.1 hypothetical protein [Bradyrhizobium sp. IC4061]
MTTMAVQIGGRSRWHAVADWVAAGRAAAQAEAFSLVLPLVLFILIAFVLPIGRMMLNAVHDDTLLTIVPRTTVVLSAWDGKDRPERE